MYAGGSGSWGTDELAAIASSWNVVLSETEQDCWRSRKAPDRADLASSPRTHAAGVSLIRRARSLLYDGPGVALLHGAPAETQEVAESWLWSFGTSLGVPVPQSLDGALIGRVEDIGADHSNPTHRGHKTSAALPFHADRTDVIALLCVRNAVEGGLSKIASATRVRELLATEKPDLLEVLEQPLPHDRRGEEPPGERPWCLLPVFSVHRDRLVCRYIRRFVESSQRHPDAPRLTAQQVRAMDAMDAILTRPQVVVEMGLEPGQIQLIENHTIMHARSAFRNAPRQGRLLLRLWLSTDRSPELPDAFAPIFGATSAGSVRGGVWPRGADALVGHSVSGPQGLHDAAATPLHLPAAP